MHILNEHKLSENFNKRGITVKMFDTFDEIMQEILSILPAGASVGIGNSQTLKQMQMTERLVKCGHMVYDKTFGKNADEIIALKRKSLLTDYYISGANAISQEGHIVNIDHSGNRVAALSYGPKHVFIIAGKNKIAPNLMDAIARAKNIAAPLNAQRAGYHPPCVAAGVCVDCYSEMRVCNVLSIIEGQSDPARMTVFIADEDAGF